jgi:two-component system, chemotaxis family, protein-glutamate methylesterase/glutaminase
MNAVPTSMPDVDAVVIGASAGGLQALMTLLPALPPDGPPVLIVLHRGPQPEDGPSMADLLSRHCRCPVTDALDGQPLQSGLVLLAPADYHLLVDPGPVAALSVDAPVLWSRPAIDPLFDSASAVFGARLLALVLTGASADGSAGASVVRTRGGQLWVQDPQDAHSDTMPRAALARAGADGMMSLNEMVVALRSRAERRKR